MPPALVVDAANVVGSVPDGWWRDRAGANLRLRDALAEVALHGLPRAGLPGPVEVYLVVEGQARGLASTEAVRVVSAPGSGDDAIVDLCALLDAPVVVTADQELIRRVEAEGARVLGPRSVPRR
jgi:hypothetical protein